MLLSPAARREVASNAPNVSALPAVSLSLLCPDTPSALALFRFFPSVSPVCPSDGSRIFVLILPRLVFYHPRYCSSSRVASVVSIFLFYGAKTAISTEKAEVVEEKKKWEDERKEAPKE